MSTRAIGRTIEQIVRVQKERDRIEETKWASLGVLYQLMPNDKQREFWQLRTDPATKEAFLLRWGHFEQGNFAQWKGATKQ